MKDMLQSPTRRQLLSMIGKTAGATAMYQAMTTLGFASESSFKESMDLKGAPAGASVVILGAGLGGLTAAYELRKAGYNVKVLEFQNRGGGRSWTLNSGDEYTELGGGKSPCDFDKDNYLAGAPLGNWHAPNITPDKASGIGSWSEQDIVTYLRTGELDQRAYAGGPMGEAVAHSIRYLKAEDLGAIASYLKAVPAIQTDDKLSEVNVARLPSPVSESITHDLIEQKDYLAQAKASVGGSKNSPQALYLAACGSCHGVNGYAQPDARYAPIVGLSSIRRDKPDALINVIAHGIDGATNTSPKMPGFSEELNSEQIAGITNYVRVNFGGLGDSSVSAADVDQVMNAEPDKPFLIKYAGLLATLGIIAGLLIIAFIIWRMIRSPRRR